MVLRIYYRILSYRITFWNECNTSFNLIKYKCSLLQHENFIYDHLSNSAEEYILREKKKCRNAPTAKMCRLSVELLKFWRQKI